MNWKVKDTWKWRLWKTLPPTAVKDETFCIWRPSSSNFDTISESGMLCMSEVLQIWTTASLSSTWVVEMDGKDDDPSGPWASLRPLMRWVRSLCDEICDRISSFLWVSLSTCFLSSGMYFKTRDTVAGMLNFCSLGNASPFKMRNFFLWNPLDMGQPKMGPCLLTVDPYDWWIVKDYLVIKILFDLCPCIKHD